MATENLGSRPPSSPGKRPADSDSRDFASALELPIVMVAAIVIGGLVGYLLDRWLHTKPVFLIVFGALGLFAGVRDVLRRVAKDD